MSFIDRKSLLEMTLTPSQAASYRLVGKRRVFSGDEGSCVVFVMPDGRVMVDEIHLRSESFQPNTVDPDL